MALTLNNFWGGETGGLEETNGTTGTPTVEVGSAHSGGFGYRIADVDRVGFDPYESVADAGGDHITGLWVKFDQVAPQTENDLVRCGPVYLRLQADGDLLIRTSVGSLIRTVTAPFTVSTWHFLELYVEDSATGTVELFIDGVSQGTDTASVAGGITTISILGADGITPTVYTHFDDIYHLSGAASSADRLGGSQVLSFRSDENSVNADGWRGGVFDWNLNSGTWLSAQEIPFDESGVLATYDDTTERAGFVDTDDFPQAGPLGAIDYGVILGTWYLDASDSGPTDSDGAWADDADAFDGSLSTFARTLLIGSISSNNMVAAGTTAPGTLDPIGVVEARAYGIKGNTDARIYLSTGASGTLGTPALDISLGWGKWVTLDNPSGGWTAAKIQAIGCNLFQLPNADTWDLYKIEIRACGVVSFGTIEAMKGIWRMKRSGGSGAVHYGLIGNSGTGFDTGNRTVDFNPTTGFINYFDVRETDLPTASDYGSIGFEKDNKGQDFICSDMLYQVLNVPPADTGIDVTPDAVASEASVPQPALDPSGAAPIDQPGPVASAKAVPNPTIDLGTLNISQPGPVASAASVPQPALSFAITIQLNQVASEALVPDPALQPAGVATIEINNVPVFRFVNAPAVDLGTLTIALNQVASVAVVQQPAIAFAGLTVEPQQVVSEALVPDPAIDLGTLVVALDAVPSEALVPDPGVGLALTIENPRPVSSRVLNVGPNVVTGIQDGNISQTDGENSWVDDANCLDGSTSTYAYNIDPVGWQTLHNNGNDVVPLSLPIAGVEGRTYGSCEGTAAAATSFYLAGGPNLSVRHDWDQETPGWTPWIDLQIPLTGWNNTLLGTLADWHSKRTFNTQEMRVYATEVRVTYFGIDQQPALTSNLQIDLGTVATVALVPDPALALNLQIDLNQVASVANVPQPAISFPAIEVALNQVASASTIPQPAIDLGTLVIALNQVASEALVPDPGLGLQLTVKIATGVVVQDSFTGTNSTPLSTGDHSPEIDAEGGGWSEGQVSLAEVQDNRAESPVDLSVSIIDSGLSDFQLNAIVNFPIGSGPPECGLVFRWNHFNEFWFLHIQFDGQVELVSKIPNYAIRDFDTHAPGMEVGADYKIQVICEGTSITCTVDGPNNPFGVTELNWTSAAAENATVCGLRFRGGTIDDLLIQGKVTTGQVEQPALTADLKIDLNQVASVAVVQQPAISQAAADITVEAPGPVASVANIPQPAIDLGTLTVALDAVPSVASLAQPGISMELQMVLWTIFGPRWIPVGHSLALDLKIDLNQVATSAVVQQPAVALEALQIDLNTLASVANVPQPALSFATQVILNELASAASIPQPTVALEALLVQLNAVASQAAVNQPAVGLFLDVILNQVASAAVVPQPAIDFIGLTVVLSELTSVAQVEQPAIDLGTLTIELDALVSVASVPQPAISFDAVTVVLNPVVSVAAVEQPALQPSGQATIELNTPASAAQVEQPALQPAGVATIELDALASVANVPQPQLLFDTVVMALNQVPSQAVVQQPALLPAPVTISLNAVASQASVNQPAIAFAVIEVALNPVVSSASVEQPALQPSGSAAIELNQVASTALVPQPGLALAFTVQLNDVPSQAVLPMPALVLQLDVLLQHLPSAALVQNPSIELGAITVDLQAIPSAASVPLIENVLYGDQAKWHEIFLTENLTADPEVTAQCPGTSITAQLPDSIKLTK